MRQKEISGAGHTLKREKLLLEKCKRRPSQQMNNIIEQDHRFIKRHIRPGLGFISYPTAWRTIRGYEAMHMWGYPVSMDTDDDHRASSCRW
jgi:transposase-like protein